MSEIPEGAVGRVGPGPALVVSAAPGDEILGCAGAILRHLTAAEAVRVVLCDEAGTILGATAGEAEALVAESNQAAALLGTAVPTTLGRGPAGLRFGEGLVRRLADAIEEAGSRIVYAPGPGEGPCGRRAVALAVLEAVRRLGRPDLTLAHYELTAGQWPNLLLDISGLLERKVAAVRCLATRLARGSLDVQAAALARYRTVTLPPSVTAAEAFRVWSTPELQVRVRAGSWLAAGERDPPSRSPRVSVIVRTLGRSTLRTALDSVAAQTHDHIEVVLVDAAGKGLAPPSEASFSVQVVSTGAPLSRSEAANHGLAAATGVYLMFLDDDDWLYPDHLARLAGALEDERLGRAVYAGVETIALDGDAPRALTVYDEPFDALRLRYENFIPVHAMMFARSLVEEGCRFDPSLPVLEDWDFWIQISRRTTIRNLPGVSAAYRYPGASSLHDRDSPDSARATAAILDRWSQWTTGEVTSALQALRRGDTHVQRVLEARFAEADAQRRQLRALVASLTADLAGVNADLAGVTADLERVREEGEAERARHAGERAQLREEASRARGTVDDLKLTLAEREARIAELLASASWRLTGPLRFLHTIARKGRRN